MIFFKKDTFQFIELTFHLILFCSSFYLFLMKVYGVLQMSRFNSFLLVFLNENSVVLSAKVRELNIGFWDDKVIMIVSNGGLMQI